MIILIKNGTIISMDESKDKIIQSDIVIQDNKIKEICKNYKGSYDKVIDATNKIVMPGLINSHTHIGMSIFRSTNDSLNLDNWLKNKIWPIEDKMTDDDMYYTSLLSIIEMIKTGTTTFNDMYFGWKGTMKAIDETGIRASMSRCLTGGINKRIDEFKDLMNTYKNDSKITFTVSPHSLYTCDNILLQESYNLYKKYNLPSHIHFCEDLNEVSTIRSKFSMSPVNVLKNFNYLDRKLILAHGTYIDDDDLKLLNENTSIVTNPLSNLNLGCGIADLVKYKKYGLNIALGTDGQGSGNSLNLFKSISIVSGLQKAIYKDPTVMDAYEVLKMATINGAKTLGLDDKIGSIEPGKCADIIILDLNNIEVYPSNDIICNIVNNTESSNIITTIIDGKIIMEDRKMNIDEEKLKEKINRIIKRLKLNV